MAADADRLLARYEQALQGVEPPFAFIDLDALRANGARMLDQAAGLPIRVASKSVRSVEVLRRILQLDDRFRGILAFTLPEALFLSERGFEDMVVAYPTADRSAISELGALAPERAPTLMVDEPAHLELIDAARGSGAVRLCLDVDVGWWPLGGRLAKIGPKRSPIRTPDQARALALEIDRRPGLRLEGLMAYEGHIAGVGDRVPGHRVRSLAIQAMQAASEREIVQRLPGVVAALREVADLRFVNGGGTGSLARTAAMGVATEVTAGSGFYAPALFDQYRSLDLAPAAFFALPVVRKPAPGIATVLGGGYVASGAPGRDRLPKPYLPHGLRLDSQEGAGEVQTPVRGPAAPALGVGDRVYFRHAKAGELCERFSSLHLIEGDRVVDEVPTYRGEGKTFL